jgi:hypothetical protein
MTNNIRDVGPTVRDYLLTVRSAVNEIKNPNTGQPVQIPDFATIHAAAGQLDSTPYPEDFMFVIQSLLGRASSVDMDIPASTYTPSFPLDHHPHASMGVEWYWLGCHMSVTDRHGNAGRISVLLVMAKTRAVGLAAQKAAGWTDQEVTLACNVVTVTVDMGPGERAIHRRSRNLQWQLKGGVVNFSVPGQDFLFQCGPDSLRGSADVMPLAVVVNDGTHMAIDLTLRHGEGLDPGTAFFLQGPPTIGAPITAGGTGVTPLPTPGIYYSWPQLVVDGAITIDGETYTITSGSGWLDHQLMMSSLKNPPATLDPNPVHPVPFLEDPRPYNGWVWQFYNLDNGQAFTGAGFIVGEMTDTPSMVYGYFLTPNGAKGWDAIFINGDITLLRPIPFRTIPCDTPYPSPETVIPTARAYTGVQNILLGKPLSGVATPWHSDGTFSNPNWSVCAEIPADYTDMSGQYANGVGYMESVGFQSVDAYRDFALTFLKRGAPRALITPLTLTQLLYGRGG